MSDLEASETARTLIRVLERQQELVARLAELADEQGPLIDASDSEALLTLLAERQQIMDEFTASQDEMTGLTESLNAGEGDVPRRPKDRIGSLIEEITRRLEHVMTCDRRDREALQSSRDETARALSGVRTAQQARQAYVKARVKLNRFADRKG